MTDDKLRTPPIEFPCDFIIKVVGKANKKFETSVLDIIHKHFPTFSNKNYTKRLSRDANFLALTITIHAESKEQLDAAYQDLSDCKEIIMAL